MFDVAVLGGGIAGVAAALAARTAGARVVLVARSPGASALGGGGWIGTPPAPFQSALEHAGYPLADCTQPLPHPDGSFRRFDYCAPSHARGVHDGDTIVGIHGLPGFRARALATLYSDARVKLNSATIELPHTPSAGWSPVSLAANIEAQPGPLIDTLHALGANAGIVLPPILGRDAAERTHRAIEQGTGRKVTEALGVPPSLPGWRLQLALRRCLDNAEVSVITGAIADVERDAGSLRAVHVGGREILAGRFVLATGKFLGGGIAARPQFADPVLGIPVWIDHLGERFTEAESLAMTDPERAQAQVLLEAGVRTDEESRPLGHDQQPVFDNVFVAGTVKAGVTANAGLGWGAQDGWLAGEKVAR